MTEHNKEVIDKMIEDLKKQGLDLFRSVAKLDETIRDLEKYIYDCDGLKETSTYLKESIKDRLEEIENYGNDMSISIMCEALGKLE